MITATKTLYLYVETPLHAGVGSGLSSIDLPIQRERTTQYPMIQGSSIKGKLRSAAYQAKTSEEAPWTEDEIVTVFGPEKDGADHAGALIAGDARILLFPVRSLNGVFAYITSFDVLNRFQRDMKRGGPAISWTITSSDKIAPKDTQVDKIITASDEIAQYIALVSDKKSNVAADDTLVLEEFSFTAQKDTRVDDIATWLAENAFPETEEYAYWRAKVKTSLVILSNNDFRDFVVNATEIITRVRIKRDTKTVEGGALWTEEHLPTDTLLYVPIYATDARKLKNGADGKSEPAMLAAAILKKVNSLQQSQQGYIQLGGDETVGRGMVRMHWSK